MKNDKELPGGRQTLGMITPLPPSVGEKESAPPPTTEEANAANRLTYAESTSIAETIGGNKILRTLATLGEVLGITGVSVGVGYGAYRAASHFFREAPSDFTKHVNEPLSVPAVPEQAGKDRGVNPKEIFDNTATKGVFTERNSVAMTPKQYQETSPRLINGDSVVIPLPIEFPQGQIPNLKLERERGQYGGIRKINARLNPEKRGEIVSDGMISVKDVLIISGVPVGGVFLSPFDGEIEFPNTPGYEKPDGSLSGAGFSLYSKDSNGNNVILKVSTVRFKPLIKPSRIEFDKETNQTKPLTKESIKVGDPIGIILTKNHDNPEYDGQIYMIALSGVQENGQRRGGAAEIQIATSPEGQAIRLERGSESK